MSVPSWQHALEDAKKHVEEVSVQDYLESKDQWVLVDVRREQERREHGAIAVAHHCMLDDIQAELTTVVPDKKTPIIFYCAGGVRSLVAGHWAKSMGYEVVRSLRGGFAAWEAKHLP